MVYGLPMRADLLPVLALQHETCDMNTFRSGAGDRGASIRIPLPVEKKGYGYLEDRRPSANVDPYTVARLLIKVCHLPLQLLPYYIYVCRPLAASTSPLLVLSFGGLTPACCVADHLEVGPRASYRTSAGNRQQGRWQPLS